MFRNLKFAAAALLLTPAVMSAQDTADDGVVMVDKNNTEMNAAMARAKKELPAFYARMKSPQPKDEGFVIKFNLDPTRGAEYIWAGNLEWRGSDLFGTLNNVPRNEKYSQGQQIKIPQKDIVDWSYWDGTTVQGEYTTRVLLPMMPAEMRAQVLKNNGW
jgi:uncharacterized protein YegJ (DUF2314 family)